MKGIFAGGKAQTASRSMNWLVDIEPFSRSANVESADDRRLKKAIKIAVEKEFAPQSLIDSIKSRIRNADESK